jgi:hypothetical protein
LALQQLRWVNCASLSRPQGQWPTSSRAALVNIDDHHTLVQRARHGGAQADVVNDLSVDRVNRHAPCTAGVQQRQQHRQKSNQEAQAAAQQCKALQRLACMKALVRQRWPQARDWSALDELHFGASKLQSVTVVQWHGCTSNALAIVQRHIGPFDVGQHESVVSARDGRHRQPRLADGRHYFGERHLAASRRATYDLDDRMERRCGSS